jgi:hypothetical protein
MSKLGKFFAHPVKYWVDWYYKKNGRNSPYANEDFSYCTCPDSKILLHSGEGLAGLMHISMWVPVLENCSIPFTVLVRNRALYQAVRTRFPNVSLAFATTPGQVEIMLRQLVRLSVVLYPSNTGNNIHLLRFNYMWHVFIGHGDSDKSSSAHKFFRVYDEVWVAGQAHIDRFLQAGVDLRGQVLKIVGRPNLERFFAAPAIQAQLDQVATQAPARLLYAPTWEGYLAVQSYSSLFLAEKLLSLFEKKLGVEISIKLHPLTGQQSPQVREAVSALALSSKDPAKNRHLFPRDSDLLTALSEPLNIILCDVSAVVTEALVLDVPIFIYENSSSDAAGTEVSAQRRSFAYVFSSAEELEVILDEFARNGDRLKANRVRAAEHLMGRSAIINQQFSKELNRLIGIRSE